jgi:ABC-type sugar transport system ATPase subunit
VPHLTVAENILLGRWPNWHGLTTHSAALRRAHEECEHFNIALDLRRSMSSLKLADRQIVEIVKALTRRAQLIVLDEPTASHSDYESRVLFETLGRLTADGVGIIYIQGLLGKLLHPGPAGQAAGRLLLAALRRLVGHAGDAICQKLWP